MPQSLARWRAQTRRHPCHLATRTCHLAWMWDISGSGSPFKEKEIGPEFSRPSSNRDGVVLANRRRGRPKYAFLRSYHKYTCTLALSIIVTVNIGISCATLFHHADSSACPVDNASTHVARGPKMVWLGCRPVRYSSFICQMIPKEILKKAPTYERQPNEHP